MIIYFVIMAFVSMIFTIMGICMGRSKEPVGFWTGQEIKSGKLCQNRDEGKDLLSERRHCGGDEGALRGAQKICRKLKKPANLS